MHSENEYLHQGNLIRVNEKQWNLGFINSPRLFYSAAIHNGNPGLAQRMADRFCIWIVSPEGLIWSHVFDEVALGLQHAFGELGYDVPIVTDAKDIQGTALVLGANLAAMHDMPLPPDAIIYNLEQVHEKSRWFGGDTRYLELLKRHAVWDFSRVNKQALEDMGVGPVVLCPVGYAPVLTKKRSGREDAEVLFIGGAAPRRLKVLDDLKRMGVRPQVVYKVFGEERDQWMMRGKVHLNMHKEPAELFEIVRVSYLLANRCFVVSERGRDVSLEQPLEGGLVFAPYEKLPETCMQYLVKPQERRAIAEAGFDAIRTLPQREFLDRALTEHYALRRKPGGAHAAKIFVAIAAYRDPELQPTVSDLLRQAAQPERICVGVCQQVGAEDADCVFDAAAFGGQVRMTQVDYADSKGANWARCEALKLMDGEEYVLLIDSHMRFEPGWDEALIGLLEQCEADKPVLTAYCPNYDPPGHRFQHPGEVLRIRVKGLGSDKTPQLVQLSGLLVSQQDEPRGGLYPSPFIIANFLFGRASMLREVPLDAGIRFWGDEINYAARLWTHGYDVFQPDRALAYHYWVRKEQFYRHGYREGKDEATLQDAKRMRGLLFEGADEGQYGLGAQRALSDFWEFAGIDWQTRRYTSYSEQGIWNMAARKKGRKAKAAALPRIFVQIASYRDPECQHTVKDLFEKAAHPERVFVGICWQFVKGEDDICFEVPYPRPQQVRVHEVDAHESGGACWARNQVQQLWRGEEYTLQLDSHMRFEPGWDETLLAMLRETGDDKAVLTCYAPGYTPPDELDKRWLFGMSAKQFDAHRILLMHGKPAYNVPHDLPEQPVPGAFLSAHMVFGPGSIIRDVPYDPKLYFFGEEITLAVRLWTHGYNLYHPHKLVIYHDWDRGKRPTHFSDHKDWTVQNERAFSRVRHLLGTEACADATITEGLEQYGLGSARSLQEYQQFSGVDFTTLSIAQHALEGWFADGQPHTHVFLKGDGKMPRIFVNIASYRDPECQHTVRDLFEKARHPERIFVGICWQYDEEEDKHCFAIQTRPEQVRILPVNWRDAEGVCWARNQAQQLWEGEEYMLMIDSHMRFMPGWDEDVIAELARCEGRKPVISSSPPGYTPPDQLSPRTNPSVRRAKPFMPDGNIRCQGEMLDHVPEKPLHGAFLVANFMFSRSEVITEVPYDPYMYFDQEEISYAARLYTHGWDIFHPTRPFAYHYYNDAGAEGGSVRPLHWRDLQKEDTARIRSLRERGLKRFNHLTGYERSLDPQVTKDMERYGFGRARTLAQYEAFSGVDFKRKVASERALQCEFIPNLRQYRAQPFRIPEQENKERAQAPMRAPRSAGGAAAALALQPRPAMTQQEQQPLVLPMRVAAAAVKLLEPGDYMPPFEVYDSERKLRTLEGLGGRHCLLVYQSAAHPEKVEEFYKALEQRLGEANLQETPLLMLMDDVPERVQRFRETFKIALPLYPDPDRRIGRSLGVVKQGQPVTPTGFVLDNNLKISQVHRHVEPGKLAALLANGLAMDVSQFNARYAQPKTLSRMAPALIVPDVLTPELCAKCINAFRNGNTFDGTIGAGDNKAYRADVKIRTDFIVRGALLEELDDKLSRSYFPEIKKALGVEILHREMYKIGVYKGENGGFFRQHRDNYDYPMGYRRIASTIHLNDEYEGGGLRFPEYGPDICRPETGSAIAFNAALLHEALPVTKGERFVVVAFLHGREEEAYRRYYAMQKNEPLRDDDYKPTLRQFPELRQSRWFYKEWYDKNARYDAASAPLLSQAPTPTSAANVNEKGPVLSNFVIGKAGHRPRKVFDGKVGIVYDDFLPEETYERLARWARTTDYQYINTHGNVSRAWHIQDGFPLRSALNSFYHVTAPNPKPDYVYPLGMETDGFIEAVLAVQPEVQHLVGRVGVDWEHFSVTSWIYPQGTGLAMHDDGSGVYTGAYAFFMNETWRAHWGGLLLVMDDEANEIVRQHRSKVDQIEFYRNKFLHTGGLDEMLLEHGLGRCIFPKRNRIAFIANDAYHIVSRVNEQSGDHVRMSLAGFFNRKK